MARIISNKHDLMEWKTETKDSEPENQKSLDYGDKVLKRGEWGVFFFVTCLQHGKCISKLLAKTRKKNSLNYQRAYGEEPCDVHGF